MSEPTLNVFCPTGPGGGKDPTCGGSESGPTISQAYVSEVVRRGKADGNEHVLLLSKQGDQLAYSKGTNDSADAPRHELLNKSGSDLTLLHNHPDNSVLSPNDFKAFDRYHGVDTIAAATHDGTLHTASIIGDRRVVAKAVDIELARITTVVVDKLIKQDVVTDKIRQAAKVEKLAMMGKIGSVLEGMGLVKLRSITLAQNVFCPTGPGGGKDPTCSVGGKGATRASISSPAALKKLAKPAGDVQLHGMAKSEKMLSVHVDGVEVVFTAKTAKAAHETLVNSTRVHGALWKQNKKLVFTSQGDRKAELIAKANGLKEFDSAASGGDGSIVVYSGRPLATHDLAHESAHNLAFNTWGSGNPNVMDRTNNFAADRKVKLQGIRQRVSNPITEYGAFSPAEDFAEFVTAYNEIHVRKKSEYKGATAKTLLTRPKGLAVIKKLLGD